MKTFDIENFDIGKNRFLIKKNVLSVKTKALNERKRRTLFS